MRKEILVLGAVILAVIAALWIGSSYYRAAVQAPPAAGKKIPDELVRPDSAVMGPADAKVTIVEFYDPECEACAQFAPELKKLLKEFEGKVRLVSRYAPFHKNARIASIYTEAAGIQGKYWEMQDKLFQKQDEWGEKHGAPPPTTAPPPVTQLFDKYAQELGLNLDQLKQSVADQSIGAKVDRDLSDSGVMKVERTPTFFVNGRRLAKFSALELRALIQQELAK